MNILCVDQYAEIGGAQRSLLDLLPAFSQRGWRPSVAAVEGGTLSAAVRGLGYFFHPINCGSYTSGTKPFLEMLRYGFGLPTITSAVKGLVRRHRVDLLYVNGPRLFPHAAWVARSLGIPLVFHCHNRLWQYPARALTRWFLRHTSTHLIGCCEYVVSPFRRDIPAKRLSILYNGVRDLGMARTAPDQKVFRIGVVGRVDIEKGQLEFVLAASSISHHIQRCRFVIIGGPAFSGTSYYRQVVSAAEGLPFQFVDWQENVAQVYSNLDLLVVPSGFTEATTRVILEAYSAGVPVVAFPSGGISEVLRDEETGFFTATRSVEALAQRILSVVQMDQRQLARVVNRAREEWADRFTLEAYREAVCNVLSRAAA